MATDLLPLDSLDAMPDRSGRGPRPQSRARSWVVRLIQPLASLKLTVALFSLAIFLVFAGTLAQARADIWTVLDQYFRTWVAWIDLQVFFPPAWFPSWQNVAGRIVYPGGFTIGALMAVNLLVAHGLRFKVQSSGARLWAGVGVIALGCLLTWLVIVAGPDRDGSQATLPLEWFTIWKLCLLGLALSAVGIAFALMRINPARKLERAVLAGFGVAVLGLLAFLLFGVDSAALDPAAMRILWQLIKAEAAALLLLAGCVMVFRKRAGIVLLHAGIGLIMANELVVHFLHKETMMPMPEGQSSNYGQDIRTLELAVIDPNASSTTDRVVVVPQRFLIESLEIGQPVSHAELPFDVELLEYFANSTLAELVAGDNNPATAGAGSRLKAVPRRAFTGADGGDDTNQPAAYVKFLEKGTGRSLGTYLLGRALNPQPIDVDGKQLQIELRFERDYKPYTLALHDVRADLYPGTRIPQNYSSELQLVDPSRGVDRRVMIRMNEPLRYGGETFYQTGYKRDPDTGVEVSTVAIVKNFGWMIPYMACMIVATGLLAHFSLTLVRFLRRREEGRVAASAEGGWGPVCEPPSRWRTPGVLVPLAVTACAAAFLIYSAIPPAASPLEMDLYAFGKLPVMMGGRVQPVDSVARNALRMISLRDGYYDETDQYQPAVRWLIDLAARPEVAETHRIFRIDNPDVLNMLGLTRRKYYRYSFAEVNKGKTELDAARKQLESSKKDSYTVYEKKLAELDGRLSLHEVLRTAFLHRTIPDFPTAQERQADPDRARQQIREIVERLQTFPRFQEALAEHFPPRAVPTMESRNPADEHAGEKAIDLWQPYSVAWISKYVDQASGGDVNPATVAWESIFDAYERHDPAAFNRAVAEYSAALDQSPPRSASRASPAFESWFNNWRPFFDCQWLYFTAFCFAVLAWLGWSGPLNRTAFWLIAITFLVHTFALVARIYISGRPPVTNLYSSAIFIGWAAVLSGLILEAVYRLGYGSVLASAAGFATLMIADKLSLVLDQSRGDTIGVMQAVLDTQFWLATHVTTVTLGYTATYMAGLLGLIYVVRGLFAPEIIAGQQGRDLIRMIYGTICFGVLFSFVGTVLGGLWADDSWGRFWGWDPKENGALIIVLWNALVLHARWDGLIKDRGLALMAIGGNIVTSWSWFGVNQLGVGLHSYGFTEGVLLAFGIFSLSQLAMIGVGLAMTPKYEIGSVK